MSWTAALIGSTIISTIGQIKSANASADAAEYNANLAKMEASAEEARRRRESGKVMGKMRAGRAKSGVTTEGTPLMVLAESAEMAELDALNARWSGETQSDLYRRKASATRSAIPYTVGATLLGGYSQYKKGP